MQEHVHTGPIAFVVTGVSVILFLNLWRLIAAQLADRPQTEWLGRAMGALIVFNHETAEVA